MPDKDHVGCALYKEPRTHKSLKAETRYFSSICFLDVPVRSDSLAAVAQRMNKTRVHKPVTEMHDKKPMIKCEQCPCLLALAVSSSCIL